MEGEPIGRFFTIANERQFWESLGDEKIKAQEAWSPMRELIEDLEDGTTMLRIGIALL